ncbi:MAG TPA: membrane dipeptidase [Patescibacteria group bacterium]|nr:membrane dipeptidase [Patescibacteria group bacterium]
MEVKRELLWKQIHYEESTIVDLHVHPSMKVSLFKKSLTGGHNAAKVFDPFSVRSDISKLRSGGLDAFMSVVYAPEKQIVDDCKALRLLKYAMPGTWRRVFKAPYFDVANLMLDEMEAEVQRSDGELQMVGSVSELDALLKQGSKRPIGVIHCLEGAHSLDNNLDNIDHYFNRGVAYITLAHFYPNGVAYPCYPYPEPMQLGDCFQPVHDFTPGLTKLGEEVVEKMVDLGMMIDISHCTPAARKRVFQIVGNRSPLLATHVGAYGINPDPYNLKDWEIKAIANTGGVVGVIFMNYWLMPHETKRGLNFIVHTIDRFVKAGGIEHVGVGTDFDGFTDPPDDLRDASFLYKLTQRLVAEEYSSEAIGKIWGGNALRAFRDGWRKQ